MQGSDITAQVASWFDEPELARKLMAVTFNWVQTFDAVEASECKLTCRCFFFDDSVCEIELPTPIMEINFLPGTGQERRAVWLK